MISNLLTLIVSFLLGVWSFFQLEDAAFLATWPQSPLWRILLLLFVFAFVFLFPRFGFPRKTKPYRYPWVAKLGALSLLFSLGFVWTGLCVQDDMLNRNVLDDQRHDIQAQVKVVSIPKVDLQRTQFDVQILGLSGAGSLRRLQGARIRLSWYHTDETLQPGETWRMQLRIRPPSSYLNPGGLDYETYLFQSGISAVGYVRTAERMNQTTNLHFFTRVDRLRNTLALHLRDEIPTLHPTIPALTVGYRNGLHDEDWEILRETGTSHLMAISGLHVGLISGLAFFLGRWLWSLSTISLRLLPAQQAGAVVAIGAAVIYALLAGFTVPTQRALLMTCVMMWSVLRSHSQPFSALKTLFIAGFLVIVFDPRALLSAGFWLSFSAVSIIFYLVCGRVNHKQTKIDKTFSLGRMHLLLALGMAPITCLYFTQSPLVSPLANVFAIPVVGLLITPLSLLGVGLLSFDVSLGAVLLSLADRIMQIVWQGLSALSALNTPMITTGERRWWEVGLAYFALALLLVPKGLPLRFIGVLCLLPFFLGRSSSLNTGEFTLTVLDVGQGLSVVVQTADHTLVYDTGPQYPSGFNTGEAVLVPYLRSRDVQDIDAVIISHSDIDHRGGLPGLLSHFTPAKILASDPETLPVEKQIEPCHHTQSWQWDGVLFDVIHPPKSLHRLSDNNASCVLRVSNEYRTALLTGDIERETEARLSALDDIQADVMLVPHHGSATSSSGAFIEAVDPDFAVFPVGYLNRYHFPNDEVLERYSDRSIRTLLTSESGAISFFFNQHVQLTREYRESQRRFWHRSGIDNR